MDDERNLMEYVMNWENNEKQTSVKTEDRGIEGVRSVCFSMEKKWLHPKANAKLPRFTRPYKGG